MAWPPQLPPNRSRTKTPRRATMSPSVDANGTGLTYQWQKQDANGTGEYCDNRFCYAINSVQYPLGTYRVAITNASGGTTFEQY